jgi:hypothetical protein
LRLEVEALEERTVPTVVFTPVFGLETVAAGSTNDGMQHPTVNLIFSGTTWTTQNEQPLIAAAQSILSSTYLSGLTQYGSDGKANYGTSWTDTTTVASNPSTSSLQTFLQTSITNHSSAEPGFNDWQHAPIYVVISDPTSSAGANGGWNAGGTYNQSVLWFQLPADIHMIWVGTSASSGTVVKDYFTLTLSHELAETISDPDSKGITITPPAGLPASLQTTGTPQISDFEPEPAGGIHYGYRLNGYLVQPYWSRQDNAFIVPDGNSQRFVLGPIWTKSNTFTGTYTLSVTGDQLGTNYNDNIRIDVSSVTSGVKVTMNGQSVAFDAQTSSGQPIITSVSVDTVGGSNYVQVAAVPKGVAVNVDSSGRSNDIVFVGSDGASLAGIQGTVNVSNTSGQTTLYVDGFNDGARTDTITNNSVAFSGLLTVNYNGGTRWSDGSIHGVTGLDVVDGKGSNCVDVESVSSLTSLTIWADTQDVFMGASLGQANIQKTHT